MINRELKQGLLILRLLTLLSLFAAGGSSCPSRTPPEMLPPEGPPLQSLADVIEAINLNSRRIQQLQADHVRLTVAGYPQLKANLALERPRRFRLRAELTGMTGPEIDMGSNDEFFWMWIRRDQPPAVYYARHDQYSQQSARNVIPIEPHWLIDALGVVYLDPALEHEGPFSRRPGELEVHTKIPTADGVRTKVTVIDEKYRWVLQQHVYNSRGELIATAKASKHRYYPAVGVSLPRHIEIFLPTAQKSFQLDVEHYTINQLYGDPGKLWQPQLEGYPLIDVADPRFQAPVEPSVGPTGNDVYSPYRPLRSSSRYRSVGTTVR